VNVPGREDDSLWEMLTRYAAGKCSPEETRALSARIEQEPAVADLLAEILLHGVALREIPSFQPERIQFERVEPARRGWFVWVWPLAAAATIALLAFFFWKPGRDRWTVRVVEASGNVQWTGQGGGNGGEGIVGNLAPGAQLSDGTVETLSDDATVTFAFRDGTQFTAMPHTVATLSNGGQKQVHLRAGSLSADVKPQPAGKPLLIHTPTATLEVLGTRFDVESGTGATRLLVSEGAVRVTRLVDGDTIVVPARHEAVASLNRTERLTAVDQTAVVVAWSSDLGQGAKGVEGEWLPAAGGSPARLRAQPRLLQSSSRGQVTIHRVNFQIPWEGLQTLQLQPDARLRLRGRTSASAKLEVMLSAKRLRGGFAGNFFHQVTRPAGSWQVELPVPVFRKDRATGTEAPADDLQLRHIVIYTIGEDAGLEIEQVEVLRSSSPPTPAKL
jgi:ferric-dicitrate binding protein FerR (iron transport regulator)